MGDWLDWLIGTIVFGVLGIGVLILGNYLINEHQFSKIIPVRVEANLLSYSYSPSTQITRVAPVVGAKGQVSCVVYTTGDAENQVTVWDCGKYGRLNSTDKKIYQYAKEKAILFIRHSDYDTRIVGMELDD